MLAMVTENVLWPVVAAGVIALAWAVGLILWVLRQPQGNERMREISKAVQEGAQAYLVRQYSVVAAIGVVIAVALIFVVSFKAAVLFVIGAVLSGLAGYIGMNISVRANLRTAEAARGGVNPALKMAFRAGSVTGLFVVGFGLIGVTIAYASFGDFTAIIGFAFGASLISVFARLGGGIYTKAADVGADLVGKIEAGIPEDDPAIPRSSPTTWATTSATAPAWPPTSSRPMRSPRRRPRRWAASSSAVPPALRSSPSSPTR